MRSLAAAISPGYFGFTDWAFAAEAASEIAVQVPIATRKNNALIIVSSHIRSFSPLRSIRSASCVGLVPRRVRLTCGQLTTVDLLWVPIHGSPDMSIRGESSSIPSLQPKIPPRRTTPRRIGDSRAPECVAVRTQFNRKFLSGQRSQTELGCSRCVVLISKSRAFVLLRARARSSREGSKARGLHHNAMRRPEERRIFTMGQDE
jgi:hypothetical protein